MFDEALCQQGKQFANKIWNAFRLVKGWEIDENLKQESTSSLGLSWYTFRFQQVLAEIEDHFSKYRLSDALMAIYKLIYDDFCGWLLEIVKPEYQQPIDQKTYDAVLKAFENNLKVLHPFMPFLTEEIWQTISERTPEEALIISEYPKNRENGVDDVNLINQFDFAKEVISGIRTIRKEKSISFKDPIILNVRNNENVDTTLDQIIKKLTNVSEINYNKFEVEGAAFRVKSNEYFVPISSEEIDVEAEIEKLTAELKRAEGFLFGISKKLSNERFVSNAPEQVIALERKKEADTLAKIETIKHRLSSLQ